MPLGMLTAGAHGTSQAVLTLAWPTLARVTDFATAFAVAATVAPLTLDPSARTTAFLAGVPTFTRISPAADRNAAKIHVQNLTPPADIDVIRDLLPAIASIEDL